MSTIEDKGVIVIPQLTLWGGRRHVQASELDVELPKEVTRGSKRIAPPSLTRPMETNKSRLETALDKISISYGKGVYLIDEAKTDEVVELLEHHKQVNEELLRDFHANYDAAMAAWLPTINPPQWRNYIRRAALTASEARSRYSFNYSVLRINIPDVAQEAGQEVLAGLKGQLWKELSTIAATAAEYLSDKEAVTQRGKSPFRRIADKAAAVAFVDPAANRLAAFIEHKLGALPKAGRLEGENLQDLQVLAMSLAEPHGARKVAMAFNETNVVELEEADDAPEGDVDSGEEAVAVEEPLPVEVEQAASSEEEVPQSTWGFF